LEDLGGEQNAQAQGSVFDYFFLILFSKLLPQFIAKEDTL